MGYEELASRLLSVGKEHLSACIGIDGFIDRILRVVDQRLDAFHATYIQTLHDYGQRISSASSLSLNMEIVPELSKYGGNGPIMAGALASLGCGVSCIGALGYPDLAEEFLPLREMVSLYSFAQPAITDSYEFTDGKLISSMLDSLNTLHWERISSRVGMPTLLQLFEQSDLIAVNNWTMIPAMTQIWVHLQEEVFPKLSRRRRILFFDLADPSKRAATDLQEMQRVLQKFSSFGSVVLSCNQREADLLAMAVGMDPNAFPPLSLCRQLRQAMGIYCVSIHTLQNAYASSEDADGTAEGFFTPSPRISVGGGDHFNAGFAFSLLHHFPLPNALTLGRAVSGYYVRTGSSPSLDELAAFLTESVPG